MKTFEITVQIDDYNPETHKWFKRTLKAETIAKTERAAVNKVKRVYAQEYDTTTKEIEVVEVIEK